ncbi:MAG TPA: hypothetical protein ENJ89_10805 [Caldithrix abyssi]|uniref:Two component regulator propeller n=1 Tax=Caldithrix abyssi TaxID=187145 RepID=A0A7V5PS14_CALAY|nr:hypothetical protein [Caldithrix abyssi]
MRYFLLLLLLLAAPVWSQVIHRMQFNRFTHYDIEDWVTYAPSGIITAIDIGNDYVFLGTRDGGILRYDLYENRWEFPFTTSSGLRSNHIVDVCFDLQTQRWFAQTPSGIDEYNRAFNYWQPSGRKILPPKRRPDPIEIDEYQHAKNYNFPPYYRPSLNELPDFFTGRRWIFRPPDEIQDAYNRIFHLNPQRIVDNFRTLWLSTNGLGVARADLNNWNLRIEQRGLTNISPRDLFLDKNSIWIGGLPFGDEPHGINRWFDRKDRWRSYEARYIIDLDNDYIHCVTGNRRYVFFGSEYGLLRFDKRKKEWRTFSVAQRLNNNMVNDLLIHDGVLYIATNQGLNWMNVAYGHVERSRDRNRINFPVYQIAATDSAILLATDYGVYQYRPASDRFFYFDVKAAVSDMNISALDVNGDSLWIAGNQGIAVLNKRTGQWMSFPQIQVQLGARVFDIAFSEQMVWFATDRGLLKYDSRRDYWYLYTREDGLASNRVFHIDPDGDDLWLSTDRGVTVFQWYRPGRIE